MNSRGIMRVIEATIAVLAIFAALVLISSYRTSHKAENLGEILPPLLDELAQNKTLRAEILSNNEDAAKRLVMNSLKMRIKNPSLNYSAEICNLSEVCYIQPYPSEAGEEIFAYERIISADVKESIFEPKKIKVFLWKRKS